MPYKTQHMIETDRQLRVNPYVFVEDAEEDAETIVFLWKTLEEIRKYILY